MSECDNAAAAAAAAADDDADGADMRRKESCEEKGARYLLSRSLLDIA